MKKILSYIWATAFFVVIGLSICNISQTEPTKMVPDTVISFYLNHNYEKYLCECKILGCKEGKCALVCICERKEKI